MVLFINFSILQLIHVLLLHRVTIDIITAVHKNRSNFGTALIVSKDLFCLAFFQKTPNYYVRKM